MKFKDQLKFVTSHMKKNKLRVSMTILAATMGCAFLIILASVGFGLHKTITNSIFNQEDVTKINIFDENITDKTIKDISKISHVNVVLETKSFTNVLNVQYENRDQEIFATALDMKDKEKLPSDLSEGRLPKNENEIIVGYNFANYLLTKEEQKEIDKLSKETNEQLDMSNYGVKKSLLNETVYINVPLNKKSTKTEKVAFKIVGVSKEPSYNFAIDTDVTFSDDLLSKYKNIEFESSVKIYVNSLENVLSVVDELIEKGYNVYSPMQDLENIDSLFLFFKIGLIFVGVIAVIISSIGIFNTMTMAVTERTREIGVLKAIGASPNLIQRLFLMESAFIGFIGTFLAIIISYLISFALNALSPLLLSLLSGESTSDDFNIILSYVSPSLVFIATFISFGVAVLSGWRPARKATKTEVVQALRQEL